MTEQSGRNAKAVFICSSNEKIGFGHLARCTCLAKEMSGRGWEVFFLFPADSEGETDFSSVCLDKGSFEEEAQQAAKFIKDAGAVCVVDRQPLRDEYLNVIKREGRLLINLNAAYRGSDPSDIIVRGDIGELPEAKVLAGPQYKLLGADLDPSKALAFEQPTVVMSFGGSDPAGVSEVCAQASGMEGYEGKLFLGQGYQGNISSRDGCEVIRGENNLGKYFPNAAAAVVSAGITLYEAFACGTPCLVVPQNEGQQREAERMESLGLIALTSKEKLADDMKKFLSDKDRLCDLRQKVNGLVDLKAQERIADVIEKENREAKLEE